MNENKIIKNKSDATIRTQVMEAMQDMPKR